MWFWNALNTGCCCVSDDAETERFGGPGDRPVAYFRHNQQGPDPLLGPRAIVARPKLKELRAYYHLSDVGTGVKTGQFDFAVHFIGRYYKAMNTAAEFGWDQFMALWADERSGISMEAYAGSQPMRTRPEIQAFVESFPVLSVDVTSVKVSQDECQVASSCILVLQDPPAGCPSRINLVSTFRLNAYGKLTSLRMFWHPSELGGAAKTNQYEITTRRIRGFIDALNNLDTDAWAESGQGGGVTLEDPVGTLTRKVDKVVDVYLAGLPPFVATLKMVRVGQDELQAAAVIDFSFPSSMLLPPFSIVFTFCFE